MNISETLRTSVALRVPLWDNADASTRPSPRQKIDQLETYMLMTAYYQGELSQERLEAQDRLDDLQLQWAHLVPITIGSRKTNAAHEDAKREMDPELHDAIEDLKSTIAVLTDEIERLERDATKCSRVYSLIQGT